MFSGFCGLYYVLTVFLQVVGGSEEIIADLAVRQELHL